MIFFHLLTFINILYINNRFYNKIKIQKYILIYQH